MFKLIFSGPCCNAPSLHPGGGGGGGGGDVAWRHKASERFCVLRRIYRRLRFHTWPLVCPDNLSIFYCGNGQYQKKNCSSDGYPHTFIVLSLRNVAERYFGFLLRSLNALLIQNRHSLVGWEASFLKLPTPESWKKVNFMPCYLIRTSTGKNFHMVIRYTVHSHFSQDRQEPWALTGSGGHLGFICKKMYWGGKRRDLYWWGREGGFIPNHPSPPK